MKKSLLALAALGAFAGAASAQSSVTMFGILDVNMMTVSNANRTYSLGTDGMASSRLGFRGVEDLGGGMKASFWLEMGLQPDTGKNASVWGNGGVDNQLFFNRRSTVSLSNQWGELRLGRDYTPTYWNWTNFDPFGTNGVGSATNIALGVDLQAALAGSTFGTLVRANNMVSYILPGGTQGQGLYGQLSGAAGEGANGNKYWGGRIGYAAGPFDIAASYGKTYELLTGANTDVDLDAWNIAGSWNFGFMKLAGFYGQMEAKGHVAGVSGKAGRDNWFIGATAPFGQWNFKASYGGTNGNDALKNIDAAQWALGVDYNLSKRTALYATWSSINNDNATFSVAPSQSSLVGFVPGTNSTGGQVGIRHSF
ncbi:MAG TPA: porin [Rubrivivax sp.]|nr:porin [Rubrivivax sp.]HPO19776.1 porin [Rubrivivax sp.]